MSQSDDTMPVCCGINSILVWISASVKPTVLRLYGGYLGAVVCIIALLLMRPPEKVRHLLEG
jgi:hypothetical protein